MESLLSKLIELVDFLFFSGAFVSQAHIPRCQFFFTLNRAQSLIQPSRLTSMEIHT